MTVIDTPTRPLPRSYLIWVAGFTVSRLGDAVLVFAIGWAASGLGGTTAALALTLGALPRLVLLVVGGAVADRVGARRVLIAGEAALLTLTVALALALARFGTPVWLLLASSLALGTVTAFCLPAAGSQPRRLVQDDQLSRALALRQGSGQAVLMAAAPLGGVLLGTIGLPTVAWGVAGLLAIGLSVIVAVRDVGDPPPQGPPVDVPHGPRRDLLDGFRVVARTPGLRGALLLVGTGAALILPVPSLLVPLLGRASGWGPGPTGAVAGAVGVGTISAALLATRRRALPSRAGASSAGVGLAVGATGALTLAVGPALDCTGATTVAGALVFGLGSGTFVARLAPLVLGSTPRTHLARVQAVVGLVQLVPVMVTTPVLGAVAQHTSPSWALGATAAGLAACAAGARHLTPRG